MDGRRRTWWLGALLAAVCSLVIHLSAPVGAPPRPVPRSRAAAGTALRVVTFNLFHGGPLSGLWGDDRELERRLEMVIAELRALDPDVIALQEASVGLGRGNVAARVAEALGYDHVYAPATTRVFREPVLGRLVSVLMNFAEGPAILSRFPIGRTHRHDLPRCAKVLDPRVLVHAELTTPWGPFHVLSTHTSRDACQIRRVGELARGLGGASPVVLGGDLNHAEDTAPIQALIGEGLVDAFRMANPDDAGLTVWQRITSPEPTVFRRVDYILLVPGAESPGRVLASRVVLNTPDRRGDGAALWPSDHYGVLAEIDVAR